MNFDTARRKTCRRCAAALVTAMAESDTSIIAIAKRIGLTERSVRRDLARLVDGVSWAKDLDFISSFAFACGAELELTVSSSAKSGDTEHQAPPDDHHPGTP